MKMAAGAYAHECEISKSRRRRGVWAGSDTSESEKKGQDNWPGLNGHRAGTQEALRRNEMYLTRKCFIKIDRETARERETETEEDLPNAWSCQTQND